MTREAPGAGRDVTVAVHLTKAEAAEVDRARGTGKRETFLRAAGLATARALAAGRKAPRAAEAPEARACPPHPKRRVVKGLCNACGCNVGGEKVA